MWRIIFALVWLAAFPAQAQFFPLGLRGVSGGGGGGGPAVAGSLAKGTFASATTSIPFSFTTTTANQDVFIVVSAEGAASVPNVVSITAVIPTTLTFVQLTGAGNPAAVGSTSTINRKLEIWWARVATADTYTNVTIDIDVLVDAANYIVLGVTGAHATAPQDGNASIAAGASGASGAPASTGISTTATSSLLIAAASSADPTIDCPGIGASAPSGFTELDSINYVSAVVNYACIDIAYKQVSAAQSGISVTWGASWPNWLSLVTAIVP